MKMEHLEKENSMKELVIVHDWGKNFHVLCDGKLYDKDTGVGKVIHDEWREDAQYRGPFENWLKSNFSGMTIIIINGKDVEILR